MKALVVSFFFVASSAFAAVGSKPVSKEQTLCHHATSVVSSVVGTSDRTTVIDQIECFLQTENAPEKYCLFRYSYGERYLVKGAAGAELYDSLVQYFGDELTNLSRIATEQPMPIGSGFCDLQ